MAAKSAAAKVAEGEPVADQPVLAPEQADALRQIAQAEDALTAAVASTIERWFFDRLHNSPASRDVSAINHINATLPQLVADVVAAVKKEI